MSQTLNIFSADEDIRLRRNDRNRLELHHDDKVTRVGLVSPAFPISDRNRFIQLSDSDGDELGIIRHIDELDEESRRILHDALEKAYFKPCIEDVLDIEEDLRVLRWTVVTDYGERTFDVRSPRRNIRRLGNGRMIIRDVDGNRYEIPNVQDFPRHTQELVAHYT